MNYTENYHLPQWEETDRVLRTDFNRMCADIESGLNQTVSDAAAAVKKVESAATAGIKKAQQTADTAVSKADAARAVADAAYCPSFMPYATGTYTGNDSHEVPTTVRVGFHPRFLIITAQTISAATNTYTANVVVLGENTKSQGIEFLEDGFSVISVTSLNPEINRKREYSYIAFR